MVALVAGRAATAIMMAVVTGLAARESARSWRRSGRPVAVPVATAGSSAVVLGALAGPLGSASVAVAIGVLLVAPRAGGARWRPGADPVLTAVITFAFALAGAAVVLVREDGFIPAFVLLSYALAYDASAFVVGTGATAVWEGVAAGVASIVAITVAVAAVLVPPFRGASPWVLGGLAGVLAPLGPVLADRLLRDRSARAPAVRRFDSLLLLAPAWGLASTALLG